MLVLGVVAILAGILYSEGPFPISSTPLGEVLVALIMGPIEVIAANLAASGEISSLAPVFSIPVSLMVAAILLTNNLRDVDKDREHRRRTLAVVAGRKNGLLVLLLLMVCTFLWSIPAFLLFSTPMSVFLVWLAFPVAAWSYSELWRDRGWPDSVKAISRLDIFVGVLLTVSILIPF